MKKRTLIAAACAALFVAAILLINIEVTTRQGVNYELRVLKIPLYLKILDFADRHYNYKALVKRITSGAKTDEEKVMRIFEWTSFNIRKNPPELPVLDDHVWHIIVRGYGAGDQSQDVFTTLCNYAGCDAFFSVAYIEMPKKGKMLSFVKLGKAWKVFDAYNGVYFLNKEGVLASVGDLSSGGWKAVSVSNGDMPQDYKEYFVNLDRVDYKTWRTSRSAIQSPLRRLIFWLNKN